MKKANKKVLAMAVAAAMALGGTSAFASEVTKDTHETSVYAMTNEELEEALKEKAGVSLSNLNSTGEAKIQKLASQAVATGYSKIDGSNLSEADLDSWRMKLAATDISEGNAALITSDMLYSAMVGMPDEYAYKDATNMDSKSIKAWQTALGTGTNKAGDTGLITGDTLHKALAGYTGGSGSTSGESSNGPTYTGSDTIDISDTNSISVKTNGEVADGNTGIVTGGQVQDAIKKATSGLLTDANVESKINKDLDGLSTKGQDVIKGVMKDDLDKKADISYVDTALKKKADADNVYTKKETDDKIANAVTGVNTSLASKADKDYVDSELTKKADKTALDALSKTVDGHTTDIKDLKDNKADVTGNNIDVNKYATKLGVGQVADGNTGLVNGGTVFNAINELKENTGTGLVVVKDGAVKVASDSTASTVDFAGKDGNRVLTGVKTDAKDVSSAANVGYVNSQTKALEDGMNAMGAKLSDDIKNTGAVSAALAGLHHLDYDPDNKLDVAASLGHYRGKSAGALGLFYQPNETMLISAGATIGADDNAFNAGLSFKIGRGSSVGTTSKAAMAAEIKTLKANNEEQATEIKEQAAEIKELKEQVALLMEKMELTPTVEKTVVKY